MTASERAARTVEADALCLAAYEGCGGPDLGAALVAVGGYGRGELAPCSDLDIVLVSDPGTDVGELAERVWYPIWDARFQLDHSVRTLPEMLSAAEADLRVATGLLDLRHLAGDPNLTLRLRTTVLAQWRRDARARLPELHALVRDRHARVGELAHLSVPDLKEAEGGLRDATVLRALVATWLVDVPHSDVERCRQSLLDVRDLVHAATGRATDRVNPETWRALADGLGTGAGPEGERAAQVRVRELGRRITHLSRLAWRRADGVLTRPASPRTARRPWLEPVAAGVALSGGEIVLDRRARPAEDPALLLRAAVAAAERDVVLAPPTAARLVRESPPLPEPWPDEARHLLVRLLASGRGLLGVWETLEETGALAGFLPEWERIRLLPHASVIHRFTVDRHVVETCIEASSLIRGVSRPDVLMVAALLHDIGKGGLVEHSVAGEPIARAIATRMGFDAPAVDLVGLLVRHHLLLAATATTRDHDDPATVELLRRHVGSAEALALLSALTEADARATAPTAWTAWRAGLVGGLARRALATFETSPSTAPERTEEVALPDDLRPDAVAITLEPTPDGARVTLVGPDRVGLLADVAATFALARTPVRAARAWAQGRHGISIWEVADLDLDPAVLRTTYDAVVGGRVDPDRRLRRGIGPGLAPSVVVRPEASVQATVLEVRAADRLGVVYLVCRRLADLDVTVRSAHIDTLGPQAVDVFYLQESSAGVLSDTRAAQAAHAVREVLSGDGGTA